MKEEETEFMKVLRIVGMVVLIGFGALLVLGSILMLTEGDLAAIAPLIMGVGAIAGGWFVRPKTAVTSASDSTVLLPKTAPEAPPAALYPTRPPVSRSRPSGPPAPSPAAAPPVPYEPGAMVEVALEVADFTAIDVETANSQRASICAIGAARVRHGVVVEQQFWLVQPPPGHEEFIPRNVSIHGITPDAVARHGRPWPAVLEDVIKMVGRDVVVAHGAAFDVRVIEAATLACGMPSPSLSFADSLKLAKGRLPGLDGYKLPAVAAVCGVSQVKHHDAADDARVCAEVTAHLLALPPLPAAPQTAGWEERGKSLPPAADANPSHSLYGVFVSITGDLDSMSRRDARARLAAVGANHRSSVSKKTDYLVRGKPTGLELTSSGSAQLHRALTLQHDGHHVRILDEREFLLLLGNDGDTTRSQTS